MLSLLCKIVNLMKNFKFSCHFILSHSYRFRVPLNIITCTALMGMRSFHSIRANQVLFFLCGVTSLIGFMLSQKFSKLKGFKKTVLSSSANETTKSSKDFDIESVLIGPDDSA